MISCKHATKLISKSMEEPLTVKEQLALKIHLFICEFCEQFRRQAEVLRHAVTRLNKEEEAKSGPTEKGISKEAKEKILERLSRK